MSDESLQFESLRVRRLRGIEPPGLALEDLSAGVNVIYGPNASGKSTLAAALRRLLWPEALAGDGETVRGRLRVGDTAGRVEIDSGRTRRNGALADKLASRLPAVDHRNRYHLYLHELLRADDGSFAKAIRRDAVGGYDVGRAADQLGMTEARPRRGASTERVEKTRSTFREHQRAHETLRERESELEQLRRELEEVEAAGRRAEKVELALDVLEARAAVERAERKLEPFPAAHEHLRGDELERARELRDQIEERERDLAAAERERAEAERRLEANRLPDGGLEVSEVETLRREVEHLDEVASRREEHRRQLAGARRERDRLAARLGTVADADRAAEVTPDQLEAVEAYLERVDELRGRRQVLEQFRHVFAGDDVPDRQRVEQLREGIRQLRRWLRAEAKKGGAPGDASGATHSTGRLSKVVAALVVVAGGLFAWLAHPAGLVFVLLGAGWWVGAYLVGEGGDDGARAEGYRRDFETLSLEAPAEWTFREVEAHLDRLEERLAKVKTARAKERLWSNRAVEVEELDEREARHRERRDRLVDALGLDPEAGAGSLARIVEQLERFQATDDEVESQRASLERLEEEGGELLARFGDRVESLRFEQPESLDEAKGVATAVREAREARREAVEQRRRAEDAIERYEGRLDDLRDDYAAIFERLELEPGDERRLEELCLEHEAWEESRDERNQRKARLAGERERIARFEQFDESLLDRPAHRLEESLDQLEAKRARRDELREEIAQIEQRLETARRSHDLQEAAAAYRRARDELARERREDYRSTVGAGLATFVARETRDRELPAVFHRAREMFRRVTRGRYRLEFDGGDSPSFRAFDTVRERLRPLDELSSGTRLQLLLIVRVAFVQKEERGLALPLVFDETLANSDELRARSLIEVVEDFAASGRQVFYFSAQRDEVRQWHTVLEGEVAEEARFPVLDDGDAPDGGEADWPPAPPADISPDALAPAEAVPSPEGASHAEYGDRLDPPAWSPRDPLGRIHLWYLVEEVDRLYRLLEAGVEQWGQLRTLGEAGGVQAVGLSERAWRRIEVRARAVEAFAEAWSRGRGRPVDRRALEESGAVSSKFIDEVTELCEREDRRGEALVDALEAGEVKHFRADKTRELETYLEEHGYIDRAEPLAADEIRARVLAAVADPIAEGLVDRAAIDRLVARLA